jgi:hypothetical protein
MFQIETALLKFDEARESQDDKASVVKKYSTLFLSFLILNISYEGFSTVKCDSE